MAGGSPVAWGAFGGGIIILYYHMIKNRLVIQAVLNRYIPLRK